MGLTDEERQSIVAYRSEKATAAIQEAKDNMPLGHWNLAANRLYYAAFYAATALLIANKHEVKTHSGVQVQLNKEYGQSGKLTRDDLRLYQQLFQMRQTGDYGDCFDWCREDVEPIVESVVALVTKILSLI